MIASFTEGAAHVYIAPGATDFRKQITGLTALVTMEFHLDPYSETCVFIFCNKRRDGIKVLRFENNGFILATKKLMKGMKYQWPKQPDEATTITHKQLKWLLDGLAIEQKKAHYPIEIKQKKTCF